ncbi:outer membrane lipoprotein-sorting protein [Halogeometricum borinquense DSM 11551]|uniref:Outer membrane lipoprotein-sorting protein n=2 Tax=Halogeometricum borinquense TaxID=60847 RepID=E4NVN4_HALBP|nr:hypothetical protein [Halogeometricum borinquense]ADQ68918.1 outer membrane lipoprotein-sorting protein [Halogeometricum borinquense DSM 11551]ELY28952.1 outer membrane lipoprotein-sorting protein [Halogeometricum borinquense DSM 11551]RYJ08115.1 outer membrane lipoprotein-sorting protein [Halogeometricum borinquense]
MPRKQHRRRIALTAGLVGLILLAGCLSVPGSSISNAESVGDQVQARYDAIDRYEATVTKTVQTTSDTSSVRATVSVDTAESARIEYHTGPRAGTVANIDLSSASPARPSLSTSVQSATDGQVPTYGALASELVRSNNVTVERTTVLDGRQTAVVSLVPNADETNGTAVSVERRVWVDTERLIPLRIETTWTGESGETVTETVRYTNVTLSEERENTSNSQVEASPRAGGVSA